MLNVSPLSNNLGVSRAFDLVYVIDTSQTTSESILRIIKDFIRKDIESYKLSPSQTRVAIVTYGLDGNLVLPIEKGINRDEILKSLEKLVVVNSPGKLYKALEVVSSRVFQNYSPDRPSTNRTVVIITTSKSLTSDLSNLGTVSQALRDRNVNIIAVGLGAGVSKLELTQVTGDEQLVIILPTGSYLVGPGIEILTSLIGKLTGMV